MKKNVSIISVEKPTFFPLADDTGNYPTYDAPVTIGTAVSIKPSTNYETTPDYGDGTIQDQFTAFGGAEIDLETNGYAHAVLTSLTGAEMIKGGALRSADDITPDGAFAYRRKKSNGKYRYTVFYKGQFLLDADETSTQEGSKVTYTHPTWKGSFVDMPGLGYMYSVDEDDEGVDQNMIANWFTTVQNPKASAGEIVEVSGVTVSPKNSTATAGAAGNRQLTATIAPEDATNKNVTYSIAPETAGLSVSDAGNITWTDAVPAGVYTTTVTTVDGGKTDTNTLTLE